MASRWIATTIAVIALTSCKADCPEGSRYERGTPVPRFQMVGKVLVTIYTYPNAKCIEEARRG